MLIPLLLACATTSPVSQPITSTSTLLSTSFGAGPGQLGLIREPESSPEAPGSLAVDADGRLYVLDAVHERVAVFSKGRLDASIALPSDTIEDFALLPSGDIAALDRLVDRTVSVIAPNGAVVARVPVQGEGIADGGEVTGIFADASGVWLEYFRGAQVRVLDAKGAAVARTTRPGIPMRNPATGATEFVRLRKVKDGAQILFFNAQGVVVGDGATTFQSLLAIEGLVVKGDRIFVAGHELVEAPDLKSKPIRDAVVVVEMQRLKDRLVEVSKREVKASPEWVPMKQLVATPTGVAHLFVDSTAKSGAQSVEVTSW